ncbi:hypothetical protein CLM62_37440 [Streptomyces sp. SA15]|nr:hypothetical protein CLM62_37440 [Streptomyces sp. SA15]
MCVNKRREPTTDGRITRRPVRKLNFRTGGETWRVVRSLGEIACRRRVVAVAADLAGPTAQLAETFRLLGILRRRRSSFSLGIGSGIGYRSRIPQPGGVKQRKPGSHWEAGSSDAERAVCWRWRVTR